MYDPIYKTFWKKNKTTVMEKRRNELLPEVRGTGRLGQYRDRDYD